MSKRLPSITSDIPRDLRNFIDRLRELVSGSGADRLVTARDLSNAGVINVDLSGEITPAEATATYYPPPPAPTNVTATGAINNIIVDWDEPAYKGHAYAEVWRSDTNNIATALEVGMTPGSVFADPVGPGVTRYYWVRYVNINDEAGPYNAVAGTAGTTGLAVDYLLTTLTNQITSSQLYSTLGSRIDLIDVGPTALTVKVGNLETTYGSTASAASSAVAAAASAATATQAKADAILAQGGAANSATTATTKANEASTSATNAAGSASTANTRATTATTAATNAGNSAAAAATSATNAATYATNSETSSTASNTAKVAAQSAQSAAAGSANAAATSANTATTKANEASTSATSASTSATTASTKAGDALTYSNNAATSATNAAGSATTAATQAGISTTSKNAAGVSAAAALVSQNAAATSESNASGSAASASSTLTNINSVVANAASAAVSTEATARINADDKLFAQYTVKVDTNGYVSGYGLASTLRDANPTSEFSVRADKFYIANPAGPSIAPAVPFIVRTTAATINGVSVPVGVYITDGFIQNGTITTAKIGNAAIDTAKIGDAQITTAKIGDGQITTAKIGSAQITTAKIGDGQITAAKIGDAEISSAKIANSIQSSNYAAGSTGWIINKTGAVEFQNATLRGTLKSTDGLFVIDTVNKIISISV